ncbi:protein kinase domain-containing protein [Limnoglobus roseus]|uniref:non-specific serine/threonine protein kinase n=1 Tax=Limnoglobus roseus TaxID=2598579 RepID=A0A5C1A7N4_9BACT|nr:family 16 glycoside hydrolase [Limnoglobus roseus]QEL14740.1 serine/threonine protein kinase [Limnoglobus roseus]
MAVSHPTDDELTQYSLGTLDADLIARIEQHLRTCGPCRNYSANNHSDVDVGKPESRLSTGTHVQFAPPFPHSAAGATTGAYSDPDATVLALLQSLEQYTDVRELDRGGMGAVYLARNKSFGRDEVLKVVIPSSQKTRDTTARFKQEMEAIGRLNHPNIVTPYAAFRVGELFVFSMEFAGDNLDKRVRANGPFSVADACDFVAQAADGLQHAFERQVVHRDIKPSNLLLIESGGQAVVKIVDFGLAKAREEANTADATDAGLTNTGEVMGTPAYLSPEQAIEMKSADIRTDIYALGCTLYALLTGLPPFASETKMGYLMAHAREQPPPLRKLRPEVPAALETIASRMLAKNPADRYQTPAEVADALRKIVIAIKLPGTQVTHPSKSRKKIAIGAALLSIVGIAALVSMPSILKEKQGEIEQTELTPDTNIKQPDPLPPISPNNPIVAPTGLPSKETPRPAVPAFTAMFNGHDLNDWTRIYPQDQAVWEVKDAVLIGTGQGSPRSPFSILRFNKYTPRDFHIRVRAARSPGPPASLLIGNGIRGMHHGRYRIMFASAENLAPAAGRVMVEGKLVSQVGESVSSVANQKAWNTYDVILEGNRLRVDVDGVLTTEYTDAGLWAQPLGLALHIPGDSSVKVQSLEIKELPKQPTGFVELFNGRDLSGWEQLGNKTGTWTVVNGTLVGSWPTTGIGMGGSVLKLTSNIYRNFHLRLRTTKPAARECHLSLFEGPAGSGGLYRVSFGSADGKPGEETGRLLFLRNGLYPLLSQPKIDPNKWYGLGVIVQGNRIQVEIDGIRTADHTDENMPAENCRICLTLLAGTEARFQAIEIKELPPPAQK